MLHLPFSESNVQRPQSQSADESPSPALNTSKDLPCVFPRMMRTMRLHIICPIESAGSCTTLFIISKASRPHQWQ